MRMNKFLTILLASALLSISLGSGITALAEDETSSNAAEETSAAEASSEESSSLLTQREAPILTLPEEYPQQFTYDSGVDIAYPEGGVKGIYVTAYSAAGEKMNELVNFINDTELNAMVIDIKDDYGNITFDLDSDHELIQENTLSNGSAEDIIAQMEENQIYPIARIVVFKDTVLANQRPDLSFKTSDGSVWQNGNGDAFVNPYSKEVWDYNIEVAKEAAKLGFKEIQFDYVRFPEGFENLSDDLTYDIGDYGDYGDDPIGQRVAAVTDFVEYANQELSPYGVDVSVDIFGYTATIPESRGIGQNFDQISENVDVISSMIYPSHWGNGYFNIPTPDTDPYGTVDAYMEVENERLAQLENPPISRPWLQDFTASYLGAGNYIPYGPAQVEAQIKALSDNGVNEYLLWDAGNTYTEGVDYTPGE